MRWKTALAGVVLLISVFGVSVFGAAEGPEVQWNLTQIQQEWEHIRSLIPEHPLPDVEFIVSRDSKGRAYAECLADGTGGCRHLSVALPPHAQGEWLRELLYHEAGHVLHFAYPDLAAKYLEIRDLPPAFQEQWWEAFAEDFRVCLAVGGRHLWWWTNPEQACELLTPSFSAIRQQYIQNKVIWFTEFQKTGRTDTSAQQSANAENQTLRDKYGLRDYSKAELHQMGYWF